MAGFTHFDASGEAHMVDVSDKAVTHRVATARGFISMQRETLDLITQGRAKKGDVLAVARLAGIMAAKKTADLIPLCHPIPITKVAVELAVNEGRCGVDIEATVKTTGQTGIEMEALTSVTVAALTVYDMIKAVDKGMVISDIRLVLKTGGKSGTYEAELEPIDTHQIAPEIILESDHNSVFALYSKRRGLNATAIYSDGKMIVQKGSEARATWSKKVENHSYKKLHYTLTHSGVIVSEGVKAIFRSSYAFPSPSAAATVILGTPANGRREWKLQGTNKTYAHWEAEQEKARI